MLEEARKAEEAAARTARLEAKAAKARRYPLSATHIANLST